MINARALDNIHVRNTWRIIFTLIGHLYFKATLPPALVIVLLHKLQWYQKWNNFNPGIHIRCCGINESEIYLLTIAEECESLAGDVFIYCLHREVYHHMNMAKYFT